MAADAAAEVGSSSGVRNYVTLGHHKAEIFRLGLKGRSGLILPTDTHKHFSLHNIQD